jgi:hypothetical protein
MVPICDGAYDHYRYTKYGLDFLLKSGHFEIICIQEVGELFGANIQFGIKPMIRFWNRLSKVLHAPFLFSYWNPFVFLFILVPQLLYLSFYFAARRIAFLRKFEQAFASSAIGYVAVARKKNGA